MATILKEHRLASSSIKFAGVLNNDEVKKIANELEWKQDDTGELRKVMDVYNDNSYLSNDGECYVANDGVLTNERNLTEVRDVLKQFGYLNKNTRSESTDEYIAKLNKRTEFNFENSSWGNDETDSARDESKDLRIYFPYPGSDEFYKFVIYQNETIGDDGESISVDTIEEVISELKKIKNKTMDAKSKYEDLKNEVLNVGLIDYKIFKESNSDTLAIMPLEEDVAILIIKKEDLIGINYSWGGFMETELSKIPIDQELTSKVNWNGHPKDIIKSITKAVEADIINKQNQNNPEMKKTTEEQIAYLKDFIIRWNAMEDLMDDGERFLVNGNLQSEYDSFLTDNELEALSADELLDNLIAQQDEWLAQVNKEAELDLEEKNAFNDASLFVEEYKDYLIGKEITYGKGVKYKITDVIDDGHVSIVLASDSGFKAEHLFEGDNLENFINGEDVESQFVESTFALLIQEEKETKEEKKTGSINNPENRYFVYNSKRNFIASGHEYQSEASADLHYRAVELGEKDLDILEKKVLPVDPNDDSNWNLSLSDYSIIKEAIDFGVTEGDYDANAASAYFDKYKSESKFSSVIKARLVIYMEHADKHFKNAVISSQYEKALRFKETKEKLMNELLNIIKKDI